MKVFAIVYEERACHDGKMLQSHTLLEVLAIITLWLMKIRLDIIITFKGPLQKNN
jgi:hypothetical protein